MASKGVLFLLTIISLMASYSSREIPGGPALDQDPARDCWAALSEIRSCSNEIVAYFTNGTIGISPPCCQAIVQITHNCWPAVLGVLGFGPDQTDILRGYCDATASFDAGFGPIPGPAAQPLPAGNW